MRLLISAIISLCSLYVSVQAHGRMISPAGRSTAWRYGFNNPRNYDDNQLFCGGMYTQYGRNGGKCGVCGDPYQGPIKNQPGPQNVYANGVIVAKYVEGQEITAKIQITANHKGWFEFKICANNDVNKAVTQDCLDKTPLQLASPDSGSRYYVPNSNTGVFSVNLKLPEGLTCTQCVLQWRYHAGNNWGSDPECGTGLGCGNQEEFYACADVEILASPNTTTTTVTVPTRSEGYTRVCYFTNWSQYRTGDGKFTPDDVDPHLCTHLIYSFFKISADKTLEYYEWNDADMIAELVKLKSANPDLKILLAVGGWKHGTAAFTSMVLEEASRKDFIDDVIFNLRDKGMDGLDLDWEYPGSGSSPPEDRERFTQLCKELKEAFEAEAESTGRERLILSAAVSAGESTIVSGYETGKLGRYLDMLLLMSYDFHGAWDSVTGHNSPLYGRPTETDEEKKLNVNYAVNFWIDGGFPREKIVMGIPFYGRSWTLTDPSLNSLGSPVNGEGRRMNYTENPGFAAYYEICSDPTLLSNRQWDADHRAPYSYSSDYWVSYDDVFSIKQKCEYIKDHGLLGATVWSLDFDDFTGEFCDEGKYPLLNALKDCLSSNTIVIYAGPNETSDNSTQAPVKSTPAAAKSTPTAATTKRVSATSNKAPVTVTRAPAACNDDKIVCVKEEYLPDPCDCSRFYHCDHGTAYLKHCPPNLLWDQSALKCDWPDVVRCAKVSTTASVVTTVKAVNTTVETVNNSSVAVNNSTVEVSNSTVEVLNRYTEVPVSTKKVASTTKKPPVTTQKAPVTRRDSGCGGFVCRRPGNFKDPCNCRRFYQCGADLRAYPRPCPAGTVYDTRLGVCNWWRAAGRRECGR